MTDFLVGGGGDSSSPDEASGAGATGSGRLSQAAESLSHFPSFDLGGTGVAETKASSADL